VRYWDSSALVSQFVVESGTVVIRRLVQENQTIATWAWTRAEIVSAIERRNRFGDFSPAQRRSILEWFVSSAADWYEVSDFFAVRARAISLLSHHVLRAADAGQLAAALLMRERLGQSFEFVSLDKRLSKAAEIEGFRVLPG